MKNLLLIPILISALIIQVKGQKSFQKDKVLLSPGIGLGSNYGLFDSGIRPSIFFAADFAVHDYVSVGPYAGATFFNTKTGVDFGARGNFHWW
jgi:hypothetical protein